jgi:uncharacterized damage-inducible protein DinB
MISNSQLCRLNYQLDALEQILEKIPPQQLTRQIQSGKWSIQENLGHLLRYQEVSTIRFNTILKEQEPQIARYVAEEDEQYKSVLIQSSNELMLHIKEGRQLFISHLLSLTKDQLSRTGIHPVLGSMALAEWIEFFLLHEAHHIMTIFKLAHTIE